MSRISFKPTTLTLKASQLFFGGLLCFVIFLLITVLFRSLNFDLGLFHLSELRLIGFQNFYNDGFVFGLGGFGISVVSFSIIVLMVYALLAKFFWNGLSDRSKFFLVLGFTAGLANLVERIVYGNVFDYFFVLGGVFNVADLVVIASVIVLLFDRTGK